MSYADRMQTDRTMPKISQNRSDSQVGVGILPSASLLIWASAENLGNGV